ncbi:MAG: sugar ABC transporter permease [Chloroflexi bacterium]|nr:MAG: sugar ABC transporter permease [Chloroflexota bacterium]
MTTSTLVVKDLTRRGLGLGENLGRWDLKYSPYLFVSPFFILFALVGLFPLLYTAWVALHAWDLLGGQGRWTGFDNFAFILQQRQFWVALAVTLIFGSMFGERYGLVNRTLVDVGLGPIRWHTDPLASHIAIATMVNFRWTGYNALILLAGMQAISRDLYEAATIDGAGSLRRFFRITLPQLRPTIIFVIITATIGGLQIFDEPRLYDQNGLGGEDQQWMTMTIYLYKLGWTQLNFGRAASVAWMLFLVIVAIGLVNLAITRRIATGEGRTA